MKHLITIIALLTACTIAIAADTPIALLSDNMAPGAGTKLYPKGTPVVKTGATYTFVTEGDFATDKETIKSLEATGLKALFDGADWWKSQSFSAWSGGPWVTIIIDLRQDYLIGGAEVWAIRDTNRDTEKANILLSADGKNYTQHGVASNTTAKAIDTVKDKKNFVRHHKLFDKPVQARYVKLQIRKRRHQQQISDIAIWGWAIDGNTAITDILQADDRPVATFTTAPIQDGAAYMAWPDAAASLPGVSKWHVYTANTPFTRIDADGVTKLKTYNKRITQTPIYPFTPGATVHIALAAEYSTGIYPVVASSPLTLPTPYQRTTFGDMLAVNHFPGGGGHIRSKAWLDFSLDLLQQTPLTASRWWFMFPNDVDLFLNRGKGMITWPLMGSGIKDNIANANAKGLHSFTKGNEPELKGTPPAKYLESLKKEGAYAAKLSPWNTIAAPTVNLNPTALKWLEGFYDAGAKDHFQVLDLHTYANPPEELFDKLDTVRSIMAKHGDQDKPIISTEFGYPDRPQGKFRVTPIQKAQFLTRGLIIHYILGFKRVYIYSFADIGTDPYNNEHHFGLLDYDLQKKPAYHAVVTLGQQLGRTTTHTPLIGATAPTHGYQFTTPDQDTYTAVIWNGQQEYTGKFTTNADEVQLTELLGTTRRIILDATRTVTIPYGASPIYIRSTAPIQLISSTPRDTTLTTTAGPPITLTLPSQNHIVPAGATHATLPISLECTHPQPLTATLTVKNHTGTIQTTNTLSLPNGQTTHQLSFPLDIPDTAALAHYTLLLSYSTAHSTYSSQHQLAVRRLTPINGQPISTTRTYPGLDHPIHILANTHLEASFAPHQGGRMIDLIDRRSLTNQIRMDYDKVPDLTQFQHAYAIWFQLTGHSKNHPWTPTATDNTLTLTATSTKHPLTHTMRWTIHPTDPTLRLDITAVNTADQPTTFTAYIHPEYNISGYGEAQTDQLIFPTHDGTFTLPYWTDLGERQLPPLAKPTWTATDTLTGLTLRQTYSDHWNTPRIWFGHGCYNVEMKHTTTIPPKQTTHAWIAWELTTQPVAPTNTKEP